MTGRSSRSAGKTPAVNPPEGSQTQEGSSQEGRQGERVGVVPDPGPTNPHNDNVNVRAPMSLGQMRQLIHDEVLSAEQLRVLGDRIRELARAHDGTSRRRSRDQSDSDSDRPRKRRADHDLKYDAIKDLKLGATLKLWTNWKLEITRAFDGAPYKYDNDRTKVIKALMHLHEDCKTLWNNHIRRHPDDEYDWKTFISWVEQTIRDHGNFEMNTYSEWTKARQGSDQTPWTFDAYLTSLECELEPTTERTRAMDFLSKLHPSLQQAIDLSGVNPLPQTRQEMVSLATRMWEGLKRKDRWQKKEAASSAEKSASRNNGSVPGPSSNRGQRAQERGQATDQKAGKGKEQRSDRRPRWPKEFASGKNDKGEPICYKCGSTKHFARGHDKETEAAADKTKAESKETPTVKTIKASGRKKGHDRVAERVWELTDSENE
jgi:hypothetical protein